MTKEKFEYYKQEIILLIQNKINIIPEGNDFELYSLKEALKILQEYNYDNRLYKKGLVSRIIIDSLELGHEINEKIINFDNSIT